jgi:hypothetical protein
MQAAPRGQRFKRASILLQLPPRPPRAAHLEDVALLGAREDALGAEEVRLRSENAWDQAVWNEEIFALPHGAAPSAQVGARGLGWGAPGGLAVLRV